MIDYLFAAAVLGGWDMWRRYLQSKERLAGLRASQEVHILGMLHDLKPALEDAIDKNRAIMQGFINSMTDIVKISEEEKAHLKNQLAASKLGRKT